VEALGGIIIRVQTGGVLCVVVCLEQGADNSMIYIYKLYDLHAIFYSRLPVSKSIFMFPWVIFFYCFCGGPWETAQFAPSP